MTEIGLHVKKFNDKIRAMNQSGGKTVILSAAEARNLHSEIYELLALVSEYAGKENTETIEVSMDGGKF